MKNKKIVGIITLCITLCCMYVMLLKKSSSRNESELIVGIASGYAPFVSMNEAGQYEGFDIDVAHALADQLGKKLKLQDLGSMTSLFMALDQGKIDLIAWGLSITQERLKNVAMIHYQGVATTSYPLIFWKEIPVGVVTLDDMQGKTVCVEPASAQDIILSKYTAIDTLPTEKVDDALLHIQYNKAAASFVEPAIAKKFKNKYQEIQILDINLNPQDQALGIGLVVKKENIMLVDQLEIAVTLLKSTGVIEELERKWDIPS